MINKSITGSLMPGSWLARIRFLGMGFAGLFSRRGIHGEGDSKEIFFWSNPAWMTCLPSHMPMLKMHKWQGRPPEMIMHYVISMTNTLPAPRSRPNHMHFQKYAFSKICIITICIITISTVVSAVEHQPPRNRSSSFVSSKKS